VIIPDLNRPNDGTPHTVNHSSPHGDAPAPQSPQAKGKHGRHRIDRPTAVHASVLISRSTGLAAHIIARNAT
jgi:hypothetical protein